MLSLDIEKESLTVLHIAAKRALQKILSRVETEEKVEIRLAAWVGAALSQAGSGRVSGRVGPGRAGSAAIE